MKKKTPKIVIIGVISLITVLVWFGTEAYRNFTKKPETKVSDNVIAPFDPTLNEDALNKLENSLYFDPSQTQPLESTVPVNEPEPEEPIASPAPEPSPNISPTPSP